MNKDETLFLGEKIPYWVELKAKAEKLDVCNYIKEIAELRAKVSFYESRIDEITTFKNLFNNF